MGDKNIEDVLAPRFAALGLSDKVLKDATRNKKVAAAWAEVLEEAGIDGSKSVDNPKLAATLGTLVTATAKGDGDLGGKRGYVTKSILDGRIKTNVQVEAAIKHVKAASGEIDDAAFDKDCGVGMICCRCGCWGSIADQSARTGVEFTPETLKAAVADYIEKNKPTIEEQRYKSLSASLVDMKATSDLKWANAGDLKKEIDAQYLALLGPKDERDAPPKKAPKAAADSAKPKAPIKEKVEEISQDRMFTEGFLAQLHKPGGNEQMFPERMKEHLEATGGRVFTRFPPEPNGYLHIGHSKAIAINFGYARYHGGECYLRYDDTNPESEEERYIIAIREIIEWLGFKPFKITHASDHFDRLYELAEDLIKRGKGYVCHCTAEEVNAQRGGKDNRGPRFECVHRNRPIDENLAEFRAMRDGKYKPKEAMLRMKQDILNSGNPQVGTLCSVVA
jgi:glutaminyl-tRNA synthetase